MSVFKRFFKPGSAGDDAIYYGDGRGSDPHKGQISGEGSHFGNKGASSKPGKSEKTEAKDEKSDPITETKTETEKTEPIVPVVSEKGDASSTTAVKAGTPGQPQEATGYKPTDNTLPVVAAETAWEQHEGDGVQRKEEQKPIENEPSSTVAADTATEKRSAEAPAPAPPPKEEDVESKSYLAAIAESKHARKSSSNSAAGRPGTASSKTPIYEQFARQSNAEAANTAPTAAATTDVYASTAVADAAKPKGKETEKEKDKSKPSAAPAVANGKSNSKDKRRESADKRRESASAIYTGPVHSSSFLNKLDPRVKRVSKNEKRAARPISMPPQVPPVAAESDASFGDDFTKPHPERDETSKGKTTAAVSGVGAGAAVVAASTTITSKTEEQSATPTRTESTTARTGAQTGPIGTAVSTNDATNPYNQKAVDPRVGSGAEDSKPAAPAPSPAEQILRIPRDEVEKAKSDSHTGRDSALAAGVTAATIVNTEDKKSDETPTKLPKENSDETPTVPPVIAEPNTAKPSEPTPGPESHPLAEEKGQPVDVPANTEAEKAQQPTAEGITALPAPPEPEKVDKGVERGSSKKLKKDGKKESEGEDEKKTKRKSSIFGIFKRDKDKDKKEDEKEKEKDKEDDSHKKEKAAAAGVAGVAGVGAAAYAVDQEEEKKRLQQAQEEQAKQAEKAKKEQEEAAEKARKEQEKQAEKEAEERQKQAEKEAAEKRKKAEEEQKKAEQEAAEKQKKHEEALIAEQKKKEKEQEEARKKAEKEAAEKQKKHEEALIAEQKKKEKEQEEERKKAEKEAEKERKKAEEEKKKQEKIAAAEMEKKKKEEEKQQEKQRKEEEKLLEKKKKEEEKLEAERQKQAEKAEKEAEKEREKEEDGEGKKKKSLLGIFKRDKKEGEDEASPDGKKELSTGTEETPRKSSSDGRNRLHKEPPPAVKEAQAAAIAEQKESEGIYNNPEYNEMVFNQGKEYAAQVTGGTGTTELAQGENIPSGPHATDAGNRLDPAVPNEAAGGIVTLPEEKEAKEAAKYKNQVTGGTGTTELAQGDDLPSGPHVTAAGNRLDPAVNNEAAGGIVTLEEEKESKEAAKYKNQVTGGTGTTELAEGDKLPSGPHATGAANRLDPNVSNQTAGGPPNVVIEPNTGLPMDLSKGEATGAGTDHLPVADRA